MRSAFIPAGASRRSFGTPKQIISCILLFALLAVQVKIMLEACFVMPQLAAQQGMAQMEGPCAEPAAPTAQLCLEYCEYSVSKSRLADENPLFDVILGLPAIIHVANLNSGFLPVTSYSVFVPAIGPPLYLIFSRFFIPFRSTYL
ncbi:hypothetical protein [Nitrosomonas mobilis]|uniref:Uncharacterized protein n=1 Tax=Nitrosomonas mobilis TaxID=51642 RepID=A0A1G5SKZ1_9PROT|nr:hypothetical protein [Nitrosomonas mobilis]SCZ87039.1 hypothetical protein NSMM_90006 [Nitrosomonas mobilis]